MSKKRAQLNINFGFVSYQKEVDPGSGTDRCLTTLFVILTILVILFIFYLFFLTIRGFWGTNLAGWLLVTGSGTWTLTRRIGKLLK